MENFQTEVRTELATMAIRLAAAEENYNSGSKFTLEEIETSKGPMKKKAKKARGPGTAEQG